jgi:DNA-binding winged helix-turn-helix (wHTH) protein
MSDQIIQLFDGYALDLTRGSLVRDDELVHLRPQTYEVLKYLVKHRGRLISKDKLIEDVWQGRAVTDGSLGKCIEELRAAFGDNSTEYIRNVRGRGYIFEAGPETSDKAETLSTRSEQFDVVRVTIEEHQELPDVTRRGVLRPTASGSLNKWRVGVIVAGVLVLAIGGFCGLPVFFKACCRPDSNSIDSRPAV